MTTNALEDRNPQISNTAVVWERFDGSDYELYAYRFALPGEVPLTSNNTDDWYPSLDGDDLVWEREVGSQSDIFYLDLSANYPAVNLTNSAASDQRPQIEDGQIAWRSYVGNNWEVLYTELTSTLPPVNISPNNQTDWFPLLSDSMIVWRRQTGTNNYDVMVAHRSQPEVTQTISLVVYGDPATEMDETFFVTLTQANDARLVDDRPTAVDGQATATVTILNDDGAMDYGDAVAPYPTLLANNGARHLTGSSYYLGVAPDSDDNGRPTLAADGDDSFMTRDEGGIVFADGLVPGRDATLNVTASAAGWLNAWFDFNSDGDWNDSGEHFTRQLLVSGPNTVTIPVPAEAKEGRTYARFRFTSAQPGVPQNQPGGSATYQNLVLAPTGTYPDGEVEDYRVSIYDLPTVSLVNLVNPDSSFAEYNSRLAENTNTGVRVRVADAVINQHALGTASLSLGGADAANFELFDGRLYLKAGTLLDFESTPTYSVTVDVKEPRFGDAVVANIPFTLKVTDVNEKPSAVILTPSSHSMPEETIGEKSKFVAVGAIEDDALGTNELSLAAGADADYFTLFDNAGVWELHVAADKVLDFETKSTYSVTVNVNDPSVGGTIDASAAFTLTLTDVNEFPVGAVTDTNATHNVVFESAGVGTAAGIKALATDADKTATVSYSLSDSAGGRFAIDATSGVVTVAGALDAEAATSHTIEVTATSSDGSMSTAQFTILVGDVDEFDVGDVTDTNAAADSVAEDAAVGTPVGITALAVDADRTSTVSYSLVNSAGGLFAIDATSGVVTVAGALDAETATSHTIEIKATSNDGSTRTAQFTILIGDVDEFDVGDVTDTNAAADSVAEDAAVGAPVGITALAVDADKTATVSYSLVNSAGGLFAIDATSGVVTVAGALDAETATSHTIEIKATSNDGSTRTAQFAVAVTDIDETGPSVTSLQAVDFRAINGLPVAGEQWFSLETTGAGYLTVEALLPTLLIAGEGEPESVVVELYADPALPALATSEATATGQRLNYLAGSGQSYLVRLAGQAASVDLRVANLVQQDGNTVRVRGTSAADDFAFDASSDRSVTVNGVLYDFATADTFFFEGRGSDDHIDLIGGSDADTARLYGSRAILSGAGYTVIATGIESSKFDGRGGSDRANLYGTRSANTLLVAGEGSESDPRYAALIDTRASVVAAAETIHVDGRGGKDTATFSQVGDAEVQSSWRWTRMENLSQEPGTQSLPANAGFSLLAKGFGDVTVSDGPSQAAFFAAVQDDTDTAPQDLSLDDLAQLLLLSQSEEDESEDRKSTAEQDSVDQIFADWE